MNSRRVPSWLPLAGLLALVAAVLVWLLLIFAGDRTGRIALPDSTSSPQADAAGSTVEFLSDRSGRWTRADVERLPPENWQRQSSAGYMAAAAHDVLWVRVTLRNPGAELVHGMLVDEDYFADRVEAWVGEENNTWRLARSGEGVPTAEKTVRGRAIAFPVTVPAQGARIVYLRAEDFFIVHLRLAWWPEREAFHWAALRSGLAEGAYLGVMLALLGYNVLLWSRLRFADVGFYVLYLAAAVIFVALARAHVPGLGSPGVDTMLALAVALGGFYYGKFVRAFLELPERSPRGERAMRLVGWVQLAIAAGALSTPWIGRTIWLGPAVLAVSATHLLALGLAVSAWRAGLWQARYFVLSFACYFAGSVVAAGAWWGRAEARDASMMGVLIGSALEILLLSLAVGERFARTQRRLVEETERRRALQEAYADELEAEVRDRTRQLEEANTDKDRMLSIIGHDLRSPLAGLMRAADDEPGAFAHETARTGRALLLLIEDLVLWARLRAGTRQVASHPARSLLAPAVALHRALAERGGTELVVSVPEELRIETDLVLAQTLVRNLLANALKFARTRVVLRAAAAAGGVRFTVGNDGPPLPPAVAARFAAGENEPMTATGGLGLRLCREICGALGMRLEAGAGAEGGTEFGFILKAPPPRATEPL